MTKEEILKIDDKMFNYDTFWKEQEKTMDAEKDERIEKLKVQAWNLKNVPFPIREHIVEIVDGKKTVRQDFIEAIKTYKEDIDKGWPEELRTFLLDRLIELKELDAGFLKR